MSTHPGLDGEPIYLDYNATTPMDPAVVAAMQPYLITGSATRPAPTTTPLHSPPRGRKSRR